MRPKHIKICKSCGCEFSAMLGKKRISRDKVYCEHCRRTRRPPKGLNRAKRRCINCREMFMSSGPGNRICARCRHANREYEGMAVVMGSDPGRGRRGIPDG